MSPRELRLIADTQTQREIDMTAKVWVMYGVGHAEKHFERTLEIHPRPSEIEKLMFEAIWCKVRCWCWLAGDNRYYIH